MRQSDLVSKRMTNQRRRIALLLGPAHFRIDHGTEGAGFLSSIHEMRLPIQEQEQPSVSKEPASTMTWPPRSGRNVHSVRDQRVMVKESTASGHPAVN